METFIVEILTGLTDCPKDSHRFAVIANDKAEAVIIALHRLGSCSANLISSITVNYDV